MTYEEKHAMRKAIYEHLSILLDKVHKMFADTGNLNVQQMIDGSKILKNIAKADMAMTKSCYYDGLKGDDKKY